MELKPGKETSEHGLSKWSMWINMLLMMMGGVMTAMNPDSLAYAILAAVAAGANSLVTSGYAKSRGMVKASASMGKLPGAKFSSRSKPGSGP